MPSACCPQPATSPSYPRLVPISPAVPAGTPGAATSLGSAPRPACKYRPSPDSPSGLGSSIVGKVFHQGDLQFLNQAAGLDPVDVAAPGLDSSHPRTKLSLDLHLCMLLRSASSGGCGSAPAERCATSPHVRVLEHVLEPRWLIVKM